MECSTDQVDHGLGRWNYSHMGMVWRMRDTVFTCKAWLKQVSRVVAFDEIKIVGEVLAKFKQCEAAKEELYCRDKNSLVRGFFEKLAFVGSVSPLRKF